MPVEPHFPTNDPELVNDDCYGKAWMVAITPSKAGEVDGLLDSAKYAELLKTSGH